MTRKQQPRRRPPSAPPPPGVAAPTRARPATAPRRMPSTAPAPAVSASEDLSESYGHVKRDLTRIVVLGVLLLAGIYLSQFIL